MAANEVRSLIRALGPTLEYAYVTVYDNGSQIFCEGMYSTLRRIFDLSVLRIKSMYVFEAEDGSVFVDFYM